MSSVYEPPYSATTSEPFETARRSGQELKDTLKQKVEDGNRALKNASRAAGERMRKMSDTAGQLFDTPEKRTVGISALSTTVLLGFAIGFLVGRATAD